MEEKKGLLPKKEEEPWRVLEFYSGIGGMRYSLMKAGVNAKVVEAFDINDKANDVYEYNFGHRPYQTSDTRAKMIEILASSEYITQEFILSPLQFGVPYSRPRYFCLAKRKPLSFHHEVCNNKLLWSPSPLFEHNENNVTDGWDQPPVNWDTLIHSCEPVERFLEFKSSSNRVTGGTGTDVSADCSGALENIDERNLNTMSQYIVPLSLIERWESAMDIVYPDSKRCCCFTKSYYRYVKGTGSLLATIQVANLHSFPDDFQFPEAISLRQCYALLGNSLSVAVVAPLLRYLFSQQS